MSTRHLAPDRCLRPTQYAVLPIDLRTLDTVIPVIPPIPVFTAMSIERTLVSSAKAFHCTEIDLTVYTSSGRR